MLDTKLKTQALEHFSDEELFLVFKTKGCAIKSKYYRSYYYEIITFRIFGLVDKFNGTSNYFHGQIFVGRVSQGNSFVNKIVRKSISRTRQIEYVSYLVALQQLAIPARNSRADEEKRSNSGQSLPIVILRCFASAPIQEHIRINIRGQFRGVKSRFRCGWSDLQRQFVLLRKVTELGHLHHLTKDY